MSSGTTLLFKFLICSVAVPRSIVIVCASSNAQPVARRVVLFLLQRFKLDLELHQSAIKFVQFFGLGIDRHAQARFGNVPALVEWDTNIPPLALLLEEADLARGALAA